MRDIKDFLGRYIKDFLGRYIKDFLGRYVKDFLGRYVKDFLERYIKDFLGRYIKDFLGRYITDFLGRYVKDFLGLNTKVHYVFLSRLPRGCLFVSPLNFSVSAKHLSNWNYFQSQFGYRLFSHYESCCSVILSMLNPAGIYDNLN